MPSFEGLKKALTQDIIGKTPGKRDDTKFNEERRSLLKAAGVTAVGLTFPGLLDGKNYVAEAAETVSDTHTFRFSSQLESTGIINELFRSDGELDFLIRMNEAPGFVRSLIQSYNSWDYNKRKAFQEFLHVSISVFPPNGIPPVSEREKGLFEVTLNWSALKKDFENFEISFTDLEYIEKMKPQELAKKALEECSISPTTIHVGESIPIQIDFPLWLKELTKKDLTKASVTKAYIGQYLDETTLLKSSFKINDAPLDRLFFHIWWMDTWDEGDDFYGIMNTKIYEGLDNNFLGKYHIKLDLGQSSGPVIEFDLEIVEKEEGEENRK